MIDDILIYWTDLDGKKTDITKLVGNVQWSENENSHAMSMSFDLPDTNERYLEHYMIQAGDKIQMLYKSSELNPTQREVKYSFVVTDVSRDYPKREVTCKDLAWYLEKNEVSVKFYGESVSDAITMVCRQLGISTSEVASMPLAVYKTYVAEDVESIIEDLITLQEESNGKEYDYEMQDTKLRVYELTEDIEGYMYKPAENVNEYDVTTQHERASYRHSIEDMKNSVTAMIKSKTEGNLAALEYRLEDSSNIEKYGRLGTTIDVQAAQMDEMGILAKNELDDKNKVKREIKTRMVGAINARKNRVMSITDDYLGISSAPMRIISCTHKLDNGIYTMDLELEYVKGYLVPQEALRSQVIQREEVNIDGSSDNYFDNSTAETNTIIAEARKHIGKPYVWGASGPNSFDCSGFVCYVLNRCGKNVGRTTAQGLFDRCKKVKTPKPGDLVFWTKTYPTDALITHVGICIGGGKNIQAGGTKVHVAKNSGAYAYGRL